jgi:large subunit ribosomal protein L10
MTKQDKQTTIEALKQQFESNPFFYFTDSSTLTVEQVNKLRRLCFQKGIQMRVAKNTLIRKALEATGNAEQYSNLFTALQGPTAILFSPSSNAAAKVIREFRKTAEKPALKAAFIDADVYVGEEYLETLSSLKSKEEIVADIVALINSPIKGVLAAMQSSGSKLAGAIEKISTKGES